MGKDKKKLSQNVQKATKYCINNKPNYLSCQAVDLVMLIRFIASSERNLQPHM